MAIDWDKPIQTRALMSGNPRSVIVIAEYEENRLISWEGLNTYYAFVNGSGKLIASLHTGSVEPGSFYATEPFIENVPKPKKDHLLFYRMKGDSIWSVNSLRGENLHTKEQWENWIKKVDYEREYKSVEEYKLVKIDID